MGAAVADRQDVTATFAPNSTLPGSRRHQMLLRARARLRASQTPATTPVIADEVLDVVAERLWEELKLMVSEETPVVEVRGGAVLARIGPTRHRTTAVVRAE
ncbi:MAG: hypothetical protein CMJ31_02590 [Phycisphaerae bacterium]|nr:hypothetical protein [Phycisphaerae bacterium]